MNMSSFGRRPSVFLVEIDRDGLNAPWGFRLKGGIDVEGGIPLEVIKVRYLKRTFIINLPFKER